MSMTQWYEPRIATSRVFWYVASRVGDPRRRDVGVVALAGLERVVRGVGVGRGLEGDRVEAVVPGVLVEVAGPVVVLDEHDLLVGAGGLQLVGAVAEHDPFSQSAAGARWPPAGTGMNSWKPATAAKLEYGADERDRRGSWRRRRRRHR